MVLTLPNHLMIVPPVPLLGFLSLKVSTCLLSSYLLVLSQSNDKKVFLVVKRRGSWTTRHVGD